MDARIKSGHDSVSDARVGPQRGAVLRTLLPREDVCGGRTIIGQAQKEPGPDPGQGRVRPPPVPIRPAGGITRAVWRLRRAAAILSP